MPYLGDVHINVIESESVSESSSTTDHALEDGSQITDHVESDPITIDISGVILDKTDQKLLKLRKYRETGKILTYKYLNRLENVVIVSFKPDFSKDIKDGYKFSMTLKQIRLAKAPNIVSVSKSVARQTKAVANRGRVQTR